MRKLKLLMATLAMIVGGVNCAWAQGWTASEVAAGEYYLYNVGAQGYLANGARYGTHAVILNEGSKVTLTKVSDGVYTIATPHYHGSTHWFSDNGYVDSNETNWVFESVPGLQNTYKLKTGDNYARAETGLYNVMIGADTGDSKSYWKLVKASDRIDYSIASASNHLDLSFKITNARFESNTSGWTGDCARGGNGKDDNNNTAEASWNTHNACVERYHAATDVYQELSGLENGKYIVKCQGFYRADTGSENASYLYANDKQVALNLKTGTGDPNSMTAASNHFSNWEYQNAVTVFVTDGNLKIGIKTADTNNWTIWDNFQLFYCGNDVTSAITNPGFDTNGDGWTGVGTVDYSETEFYNTTGFDMYQDLTGLSEGIYALEAQGFYRNGAGIDEKRAKAQENLIAFLYAKGKDDVERSTALLSIYEEAGKMTANGSLFGDIPNWMNQAQSFISSGYYGDNKVLVEVGTNGTLRIGAKKTGGESADWTILDNFTLTKLSYATLAEAYAAEWASRKAEATALLTDNTVLAGSTQRTAVEAAVALTPSDMEGYVASLVTLRASVNNFKAAKYAYALYATNAAKATETYDAEGTTYVNITGTEKTTFIDAYSANVTNFSPSTNNAENYYNAAVAIGSATEAFTQESIKNNYNEYAAEVATAGLLGTDITGVSAPTTSAEALAAAHAINVLNYNKVVAEEYQDVSSTTLGAWTDNNVGSRRGQHWDGTTDATNGTEYFEMNAGWGDTSWSMSRSQNISLPTGKYILKVACRVSSSAEATLSVKVGDNTISTISGHQGDNGKGITTAGVASYDEGTFANTTGRGFEWKYIPFEMTADGTATLSFAAEGHALHQFVSFTSLALLTDPKVAARTALLNKINEANAAYNNGANVGTGVFQVPTAAGTTFSSAITTAQNVYDDDNAELSNINGATTTLNDALTTYQGVTLNAPDAQKRYKLNLANKGALTFVTDGAAQGGYSMPFKTAADYMAQHFTLTAVSGKTNTYTLSFEDLDGNTRYVCDGTWYDAGTGANGIRTFADGATYGEGTNHTAGEQMQALEIQIQASSTEGVFYMLNTASNNAKLGANSNANDGFYTTDTNCNWSIAEASQATVNVNIAAGVQYGTRIFPFTPSLSDLNGVTFYSCSTTAENNTLTLVEVENPVADTPYIIYAENGLANTDLTGWGVAKAMEATVGSLTGVYAPTAAPVGSYVLQKNNNKVGFYEVADGKQPTVGAYRCYLTDLTNSARGAFFFEDETTTAIDAIDALTSGDAQIFNANGAQLPALQKGMNIVKKADGTSYKVIVK